MQTLFGALLISSIVLDLAQTLFARAGYQIPGLKPFAWSFFISSLVFLAFIPDKNSSTLNLNESEESYANDED